MVPVRRGVGGGICGLLNLPRETWEAIEADLFVRGFLISDVPGLVSWRVVKNMVRYAQRGSAVFQETTGEAGQWSAHEHLLAAIYDVLNAANWQRQGDESAKRPEPLPRPGVTPQDKTDNDKTEHYGSKADAISVDDWANFWNPKEEEAGS